MKITPGTQLARYEIRSQLGAGGMGEVYLAEDTRLHRKLALKVLPAEVAANHERMRRFNQEATSARLRFCDECLLCRLGRARDDPISTANITDAVSSWTSTEEYLDTRQTNEARQWVPVWAYRP